GRLKALAYNFLATLSAFAGALIVLFLSREVVLSSLPFLLATGAGGFVYIATADLLPELHKENDPVQSLQQLVLLVLGVFFVIGAGVLVGHA
ncbi:MAG: ZIP family metal transporter, partial [Candidatus Micrarchaeia archaeon]